jgi:hypothetical protein
LVKLIKKLFTLGKNMKFGCTDSNGDNVTITNGSITVNGVTYTGKNITIKNGKVQIDGNDVTPKDEKVINITVEGNINDLKVDACESCLITGNVKKVNTGSGDVSITGCCDGDIDTGSGDVEVAGNCGGDIDTGSGDVVVRGYCTGDIDTGSGDIKVGAKLEKNTISNNSSITIRS